MGHCLRSLWDFDDLDGTEGRLRAQLELEPSDASVPLLDTVDPSFADDAERAGRLRAVAGEER